MNILVKDENDEVLNISSKKAAWLMNVFQAAADESQHQLEGITTLVVRKALLAEEEQYIPVALDMPATAARLGDASLGHRDADLTDVTGSAVNARIRKQLNIT